MFERQKHTPSFRKTAYTALFSTLLTLHLQAADFYVAPNGNDNNPGTEAQPFQTLEAARDAIRPLIQTGLSNDIEVLIRGGTYPVSDTIVFGLEDSGTTEHRITYKAYPGEQPVFDAGLPVTGWEPTLGANLSLDPNGVDHANIYVADLPEGATWPRVVVDDSGILPRSKTAAVHLGSEFKSIKDENGNNVHITKKTFSLTDEMVTWAQQENYTNWELSLVCRFKWTYAQLPVAFIDTERRYGYTVTPGAGDLSRTGGGVTGQIREKEQAWVENSLAGLDEPGEWAIDVANGKIYLWARDSGVPANIIASGDVVEMVLIEGDIDYDGPTDIPVIGLTFDGLSFAHANRKVWDEDHLGWELQHSWEIFDDASGMFRLRGADHCQILNSRFYDSGATGIRLDLHAQYNEIEGNILENLGGAGIILSGYGPGTKDVNRNNSVRDNYIHHIGLHHASHMAIMIEQSGYNRVSNNLLHDTPYTALGVTGRTSFDNPGSLWSEGWKTVRWAELPNDFVESNYDKLPYLHGRYNVIERNEIHTGMQNPALGDGNAIYVSGTGEGNVFRENYIHSFETVNGIIRADDKQEECTFERNICTDFKGRGILWKGQNMIVNNNIIYDIEEMGQGYLVFKHDPGKGFLMNGAIANNNIFVHVREEYKDRAIYSQGDHQVLLGNIFRRIDMDNNVYWHPDYTTWADEEIARGQNFGSELNSVFADPLFTDPANHDFSLHPSSPALARGFAPIDQSIIGLGHTDSLRTANTTPVADSQTLDVIRDDPNGITLTGSDADNDYLLYIVVTPPANGILKGVNHRLTYTPNDGYTGPDSFTFLVDDGFAQSATATVTLNVIESITYTWTGTAGDLDWHNPANWDSNGIPVDNFVSGGWITTGLTLPKRAKVIFDGSNMPAQHIKPYFGGSISENIIYDSPSFIIKRGGTLTTRVEGYDQGLWSEAGTTRTLLTVGDGIGGEGEDVELSLNVAGTLNENGSGTMHHFQVNSDGTLRITGSFDFSSDPTNRWSMITINGGDVTSEKTVKNLIANSKSYIEFTAVDGSFTAALGDDFPDAASVVSSLGTAFVNNAGTGQLEVATDETLFTVRLASHEVTNIADFANDFPDADGDNFVGTEEPATGWAYYWNPGGSTDLDPETETFHPENFQALEANSEEVSNSFWNDGIFTNMGSVAFNDMDQGNFQYGRVGVADSGWHPGANSGPYYAIASYTIQAGEAGDIVIDGSVHNTNSNGNGVRLDVWVNDALSGIANITSNGSASDFNGSLGNLSAGDTVTITLGNRGDSGADASNLQFVLELDSSPITPVESFRAQYGLASNGSDDTGDLSGNGLANITYFLFGLGDPHTNNVPNLIYGTDSADTSGLPVIKRETDASLTFSYVRHKTQTDYAYVVMTSNNLADWEDIELVETPYRPTNTSIESLDNNYEFCHLSFAFEGSSRFIRIELQPVEN